MASKQHSKPLARNSTNGDIMRPIISTDIMGNRNVEIIPVGAWVEPADVEEQPDAIRAAHLEDERLRQMEAEKENRLRSFQKEVKQRVWQAYQLKRQKLIQEAEQAFERERKVVQQSCLTGNMPRQDTCSHRQDMHMAIRQRLMDKYGEDVSTWSDDDAPSLQSHTDENHEATGQARKQLVSKKVKSCVNTKEDKVMGQKQDKLSRDINAPTVRSLVNINLENLTEKYKQSSNENQRGNDGGKGASGEEEENEAFDDLETEATKLQYNNSNSTKRHQRKKRPGSAKRPSSAQLGAILPQTESEVAARLRRQQTAISRRVFMDREREAVRENIRRQQHKKKIASLKKEKEEYRQQLERLEERRQNNENSATKAINESLEEAGLSYTMEKMHLDGLRSDFSEREDEGSLSKPKSGSDRVEVDQFGDGDTYDELEFDSKLRHQELRRLREMERYLDALRHRLMERVRRLGTELPALCSCGDTIWDTHPETCANNCFFYHNHRAYARALQSMLVTVENM